MTFDPATHHAVVLSNRGKPANEMADTNTGSFKNVMAYRKWLLAAIAAGELNKDGSFCK